MHPPPTPPPYPPPPGMKEKNPWHKSGIVIVAVIAVVAVVALVVVLVVQNMPLPQKYKVRWQHPALMNEW